MIYVFGLGPLGYTTMISLAAWGHQVIGIDPYPNPPSEPESLQSLLYDSELCKRITILDDFSYAITAHDVLWVTLDMPVDKLGRSDSHMLLKQHVSPALSRCDSGALVMISTQVPVGTARMIQRHWRNLRIVSAPENLSRGRYIRGFLDPARIVLGSIDGEPYLQVTNLYDAEIQSRILWMSYESAEISKHAMNAYLALNIVFANDMAQYCEQRGANYEDVRRSMQFDERVGSHAYLKKGKADGSHLLRDVRYLLQTGMHRMRNKSIIDQLVGHCSWEA